MLRKVRRGTFAEAVVFCVLNLGVNCPASRASKTAGNFLRNRRSMSYLMVERIVCRHLTLQDPTRLPGDEDSRSGPRQPPTMHLDRLLALQMHGQMRSPQTCEREARKIVRTFEPND